MVNSILVAGNSVAMIKNSTQKYASMPDDITQVWWKTNQNNFHFVTRLTSQSTEFYHSESIH